MNNEQFEDGRVETAEKSGSVTINQSPESSSVTINQYADDEDMTVNQSEQDGQDVNCGAKPVGEGSTVAIKQSGDTHSMISPSRSGSGVPSDGEGAETPNSGNVDAGAAGCENGALKSVGGGSSIKADGRSSEKLDGGISEVADGGNNESAGGSSEPAGGRKVRAKETRRRRSKGLGGLQLEKTGIWTVRCLINGKRVSKSTGTRDREEAEQFAKRFLAPYVKDDAARTFENIQAAVMTERQLAEMREAEGPQLKLADAWGEYEKSPMRRDLASSTLDGKSQVCRMFVEYMGRVFPEVTEVRHVTRFHTENYLNYLRKDTSASTYNNRLCVLREVHRTIMEKAAAKSNPWEGFPLRPDDSHTRRELTVEELARLVDVATREGPEWRTLFGIAMYTGMRLGDCCKLTWSEVDIVRSIIQKIPEKTKKYRKGRPVTIPIHKVLADLLMQAPVDKRTGYVLPTVGAWAASGSSGMGRVHHRIGKIFKNAGIVMSVEVKGRSHKAPEATFHSLRHTFVSMSANAGVPQHIVQAIVGHESTAMTRHYYHENVAALQQAVEAIPSISETGDVSEGAVAPPSQGMRDEMRGMRKIALPAPAPVTLPPPAGEEPISVVGAVTGFPPRRTSPHVGRSRPAIIVRSVDLPQPEGPHVKQ